MLKRESRRTHACMHHKANPFGNRTQRTQIPYNSKQNSISVTQKDVLTIQNIYIKYKKLNNERIFVRILRCAQKIIFRYKRKLYMHIRME